MALVNCEKQTNELDGLFQEIIFKLPLGCSSRQLRPSMVGESFCVKSIPSLPTDLSSWRKRFGNICATYSTNRIKNYFLFTVIKSFLISYHQQKGLCCYINELLCSKQYIFHAYTSKYKKCGNVCF